MDQDLRYFLCKIQILQIQTDTNKAERRAFEHTISQRIEDRSDFFWIWFYSVTR